MRRKIYSFLLLICLLLSCNGCQDTKETEKSNVSSQQDDTQKKEKSEVRSSFTTKQAETEEEQETQETKLTEETENSCSYTVVYRYDGQRFTNVLTLEYTDQWRITNIEQKFSV